MTNKSDLLKSYNDTTRVQLDIGADPEVLADIGYENFADTHSRMEDLEPQQQKVASGLGAITCADCGEIIPCAHAGVTRNGRGYTKGN